LDFVLSNDDIANHVPAKVHVGGIQEVRISMKKSERRSTLSAFLAPFSLLLASSCAYQADATGDDKSADDVARGDVAAQSEELSLTDRVFTLDHHIQVTSEANLHVIEKFTLKSLLRFHRRALLMASGTLVTNEQWNVPGPYNALDRAARAGYFGFAATYEGYGQSTIPADGKTVTAERLLVEMGQVVEWIRHRRFVRRVDMLGSSLGSSLAVELGGIHSPINRRHIGRLVLTANVYKGVTPFFQAIFFNPEFRAFLESVPNGYLPTAPEAYGPVLAFAEPAAAAYVTANIPGLYAVGPTLEGFDLPVFPAQNGRAPAIQFWGDQDPITPLSDAQQFLAEYGGPSCLSVLPGGGHSPYYEPVKETFWNQSFAFLNDGGDCWDHSGGDPCGDEVAGSSTVRELDAAEVRAVAPEAFSKPKSAYAF
jgi:pimeloyl-ACP methyl ester carboxylesterase